jgi:hypothetical protein
LSYSFPVRTLSSKRMSSAKIETIFKAKFTSAYRANYTCELQLTSLIVTNDRRSKTLRVFEPFDCCRVIYTAGVRQTSAALISQTNRISEYTPLSETVRRLKIIAQTIVLNVIRRGAIDRLDSAAHTSILYLAGFSFGIACGH